MNFTFTRVPSTKVGVDVQTSGLTAADNLLWLIGHMAASGATATAGAPYQVENFGDPVAAKTELEAIFGAGAEIVEMAVAAIKGNLYSDKAPKTFPPIMCLPLASTDTEAEMEGYLALLVSQPMPFVACCYPITNSTALTALKNHLTAISADDRGPNAQFGSFGVMPTDGTLAAASAAGVASATQLIMAPWLRDTSLMKANKVHEVGAAYAAVCAALGVPFLPLNDIVIGGLKAPTLATDYHTSGDTGTVALGLDSGLVPLTVDQGGSVHISRSITTRRSVPGVPDSAYFDMQDWQSLYYIRKNAYLIAQQDVYKRAKATDQVLLALKSALIKMLADMEALEIVQGLQQSVKDITVVRPVNNRSAGVYQIPVDIVPGFHNKGIGLTGTDAYDTFVL